MKKINILWTTDNRETIDNMLLMYTKNAKIKAWFDEVNLIIWGASAAVAANDDYVREELKEIIQAGVHVEACRVCTDNMQVTDKLAELGVEIKFMGQPLTSYLKKGETVLTI